MSASQLIVLFSLFSVTFAATITTEKTNVASTCDRNTGKGCSPAECHEVCGCDRTYTFDEEKGECIVNMAYLKEITASKNYVSGDSNDMVEEDILSTKLRERVDKVFRGIIVSAILFIACASVCVISVCVFCCHVRRSDQKLKSEVNALAKKLNIDINKKDSAPLIRKKPRDQKEESCNVVVQDANIMCV